MARVSESSARSRSRTSRITLRDRPKSCSATERDSAPSPDRAIAHSAKRAWLTRPHEELLGAQFDDAAAPLAAAGYTVQRRASRRPWRGDPLSTTIRLRAGPDGTVQEVKAAGWTSTSDE